MVIEGINGQHEAFISTMVEAAGTKKQADAGGYLPMPAGPEIELTAVLQALADPVRLQIVRELDGLDERACGLFALTVAPSTRSHHFRVLREAGVIRTRVAGTRRLVSVRRPELDGRFPGLLDAVLTPPR
jgi:DNA-binding transcriptional ArsR family regulator